MMKEKIIIQRDIEIQRLKDSKNLSVEEKMYLTELVSDAAEGTNGLDEKDKIQNVSETSFKLATLMSRVADTTNTLPKMNTNLSEINSRLTSAMAQLNERLSCMEHIKLPSNWKDLVKIILLKPWIWICVGIGLFSPHCPELFAFLMQIFK